MSGGVEVAPQDFQLALERRGERVLTGQYCQVILKCVLKVLDSGGKVVTGAEYTSRGIFDGCVLVRELVKLAGDVPRTRALIGDLIFERTRYSGPLPSVADVRKRLALKAGPGGSGETFRQAWESWLAGSGACGRRAVAAWHSSASTGCSRLCVTSSSIRRPSVNDLRGRAPGNMNAAAVRPGRGLPPLTGMSEARQDRALARWQILRPHLEEGLALIRLIPARFLLAPQRQDQLSRSA